VWSLVDDGRHAADATGIGVTVRLCSDIPLGIEANRVRGRHTLRSGERMYCALSWAEQLAAPATLDEAEARLGTTIDFWRAWLGRARVRPSARAGIQRSRRDHGPHQPTGATVAALTTSLPETPGGERNGLPAHVERRHHLQPAGAPLAELHREAGRAPRRRTSS
jgi:hypothetical protein